MATTLDITHSFFNYWQRDLSESTSYSSASSDAQNACGCFLTIDSECDLRLSDSNPWDDGLTYVLASVRLTHRLQIQLVAVTQNLWGGEGKRHKYKQSKSSKQQEGINKIKAHMVMFKRKEAVVVLYLHPCSLLYICMSGLVWVNMLYNSDPYQQCTLADLLLTHHKGFAVA